MFKLKGRGLVSPKKPTETPVTVESLNMSARQPQLSESHLNNDPNFPKQPADASSFSKIEELRKEAASGKHHSIPGLDVLKTLHHKSAEQLSATITKEVKHALTSAEDKVFIAQSIERGIYLNELLGSHIQAPLSQRLHSSMKKREGAIKGTIEQGHLTLEQDSKRRSDGNSTLDLGGVMKMRESQLKDKLTELADSMNFSIDSKDYSLTDPKTQRASEFVKRLRQQRKELSELRQKERQKRQAQIQRDLDKVNEQLANKRQEHSQKVASWKQNRENQATANSQKLERAKQFLNEVKPGKPLFKRKEQEDREKAEEEKSLQKAKLEQLKQKSKAVDLAELRRHEKEYLLLKQAKSRKSSKPKPSMDGNKSPQYFIQRFYNKLSECNKDENSEPQPTVSSPIKGEKEPVLEFIVSPPATTTQQVEPVEAIKEGDAPTVLAPTTQQLPSQPSIPLVLPPQVEPQIVKEQPAPMPVLPVSDQTPMSEILKVDTEPKMNVEDEVPVLTNDIISEPISLVPVIEAQPVAADPVPVETIVEATQLADPPTSQVLQPDLPIKNILDAELVEPEVAPVEQPQPISSPSSPVVHQQEQPKAADPSAVAEHTQHQPTDSIRRYFMEPEEPQPDPNASQQQEEEELDQVPDNLEGQLPINPPVSAPPPAVPRKPVPSLFYAPYSDDSEPESDDSRSG